MANRHGSSFHRVLGTLLNLAIALYLVLGSLGLAAFTPQQAGNRAFAQQGKIAAATLTPTPTGTSPRPPTATETLMPTGTGSLTVTLSRTPTAGPYVSC